MTFQPDRSLVDNHLKWLSQFDSQHTRNWNKIFCNNPEAATAEAAVRIILQENSNFVQPNEISNSDGKSPDFLCKQAGTEFFVEVTCIQIDRASKETGLTEETIAEPFKFVGSLNEAIYMEAKGKTPQCSQMRKPVLLAVGTFHRFASSLCFERTHLECLLSGTAYISHDISSSGQPAGRSYMSTRLEKAAFVRLSNSLIDPALKPIAGILACGFGSVPPVVRCVLHPEPNHNFDRTLLSGVEFCRLNPDYRSGKLVTEWF